MAGLRYVQTLDLPLGILGKCSGEMSQGWLKSFLWVFCNLDCARFGHSIPGNRSNNNSSQARRGWRLEGGYQQAQWRFCKRCHTPEKVGDQNSFDLSNHVAQYRRDVDVALIAAISVVIEPKAEIASEMGSLKTGFPVIGKNTSLNLN